MDLNFELLRAFPITNGKDRFDLYIIRTNKCIKVVSSIPSAAIRKLMKMDTSLDRWNTNSMKYLTESILKEIGRNKTLKRFAYPREFNGFLTVLDLITFRNVIDHEDNHVFSPQTDIKYFSMFRNLVTAERFCAGNKPEEISRSTFEAVLRTNEQGDVYIDNLHQLKKFNKYFITGCGHVYEGLDAQENAVMYLTHI